jgi:3',5'-cyclic AMP phosphodiesterase CpdA
MNPGRPLLIAQLSDLHITRPEVSLEKDVDTAAFLVQAVATVLRLDPQPDLVLITGDLVESGKAEEYAALRGMIAPLTCPVYVLPGNHDERSALREAFGSGRLPVQGKLDYVIEDWPLRIVMLDSVVAQAPQGELADAQLAWLDASLAAAPGRPTLIALHHPPFASGVVHMDEMALQAPERLERVVAKHPQVQAVVCGHMHRLMSTRFGGTLAISAPSVAHQIALDLAEVPEPRYILEPPGFLLHRWDGVRLTTHLVPSGDFGRGMPF